MSEKHHPGDLAAAAVARAALLDFDHLARQTMGDRSVETEVLVLFASQSGQLGVQIRNAAGDERRKLAHKLKGAARGIGAFAVAVRAAAVEASPGNDRLIGPLEAAVAETCAFITTQGR